MRLWRKRPWWRVQPFESTEKWLARLHAGEPSDVHEAAVYWANINVHTAEHAYKMSRLSVAWMVAATILTILLAVLYTFTP